MRSRMGVTYVTGVFKIIIRRTFHLNGVCLEAVKCTPDTMNIVEIMMCY